MALPSNVNFGTVTGRFMRAVADGMDADRDPDGEPIVDLQIMFQADLAGSAVVRNATAAPSPVTILIDPVYATTDSEGYLVGIDGQRSIKLVATDDPDLDPHGWTYRVTLSSPAYPRLQFSFALPVGAVVDLTSVVPVPSNPGEGIIAWQLAVEETFANRGAAEVAAAAAAASAAEAIGVADGSVVDGSVVGDILILETKAGDEIAAGNVRGPVGPRGSDGSNVLPTNTVINDRVFGGTRFDIRDYGAKVDGVLVTDAAISAGQSSVTSASRPFSTADVGKTIYLIGAGPVIANANDGVLISTIVSVAAGLGVATIATTATTSGSGLRCFRGTPDDAAFAAAQNAAFANGGGTVYIPPGRTLVTVPLGVKNFVSWKGENRESSWVHSVQDRPGSPITAGQCDWLTCAGRSEANPLIGADFSDFGIEAEAHIHSGGYGSAVKPLNIYYVKRCSITRMNVWNFPATAIPFDHSYDQVEITHNFIYRPGRLAPSGVGPGGSGIGAGTKGTGSTEPTLIGWNMIVGTQSATVSSPGQNGIFTEAQTGADPVLGVQGYRIIGNVIIGMYYGISDAGSTGTLIQGNTIVGCSRGIALRKTTLNAAYPGLNTIISDNTIRGGIGPSATDGVGVLIALPQSPGVNVRRDIQAIVHDNEIIDNQSWGVHVTLPSGGGTDIAGLLIHDNMIARNGRSGLRLSSSGGLKLRFPSIHHNQLVSNGKLGFGGDTSGILVAAGTIVEGGRIQDNDIYDLEATRTQTANFTSTGATLTGVTTTGNTAEPTPPAPNPAEYVDNATSAAGTVAGKPIPDGALTNKTWSVLDMGTGGVASYTGTSMIATAGTSRVFQHVNLNSESVAAPKWLYGIVKARIATLAASGTNRHIAVAANIGTDGSVMYFGPRYSGGTWKYRFARRAPGGSSDLDLFDIAATPVVGDIIGISMDGTNVTCYVNGAAVYTFPWDLYHTGRWGVMYAPDQDKLSSVNNWSYNSSIIV